MSDIEIEFRLTEKFKFALAFDKETRDKLNEFLLQNKNRPTYAMFIENHLDIFNVDNFIGYSYFPFKYVKLDFDEGYNIEIKKETTIHTIRLTFSAVSVKYKLLKETETSFLIKDINGEELEVKFDDLDNNNFNFETF